MTNKDLPFVFSVNSVVFSEFAVVSAVKRWYVVAFLSCCLLMCPCGPPGEFGRLLMSQNVRFDVDRPLDLAIDAN